MALPTDRTSFIQYCLNNLGAPVIDINVAQQQLDDRVDEALQYFYDFHWDGSFKQFYKHQLTQQDITNGYIEMPDGILGTFNIFDIGTAISSAGGLFSIQYQIALNDLYTYVGADIVPYWQIMENLQFIDTILVGKQPLRYNKHINNLYIDMDFSKLSVGQYIIAETYIKVDPAVYPDAWQNRWLLNYATALIKRQWGRNMGKFISVPLPGGLTLNSEAIRTEAEYEVKELQDTLMNGSVMTAFEMG